MSLVSIVVPVYNEVESLPELYRAIALALSNSSYEIEILFINDGSTDTSAAVLRGLAAEDPRVRIIHFRRNYGKAAALNIGFQEAKGDFVVTLDADLQDDPNEIPYLLEMLKQDYDLVSGWKKERHDPISKRWPSRFFNFITAKLTGIPLHDFNCGLKAYRREVVKSLHLYGELHRYIPVLAAQKGFRCGEKVVKHHARKYGRTKYGLWRFFAGFFDLLTVLFIGKYFRKPLHFFGLIGLFMGTVGGGVLFYLGIQWLRQYFFGTGAWIGNRPIFFVGILLVIVGVQFFSMGLLGEMITRLSIRERPEYIVNSSEPKANARTTST